MDAEPTVAAQIEQSIASAMDCLPTHWVLVVADSEGNVHSLGSPGLPMWMRYGLLKWDAPAYIAQPFWTAGEDEE